MPPASSVETAAPSEDTSEPNLSAADEAVLSPPAPRKHAQPEVNEPGASAASPADLTALWLTRRDQITVAVVAMVAVSSLAFTFWVGGRSNGELPERSSDLLWRVDINSASELELQVLKGVGPKLAARIVEERATNGLFESADDLQRVHGFGPRTIEKNRDRLRAVKPRQDQPRNETVSRAE